MLGGSLAAAFYPHGRFGLMRWMRGSPLRVMGSPRRRSAHPNRLLSPRLSLAMRLRDWLPHATGELADPRDEAISVAREAVAATPIDHPRPTRYVPFLAAALRDRGCARTGELADATGDYRRARGGGRHVRRLSRARHLDLNILGSSLARFGSGVPVSWPTWTR